MAEDSDGTLKAVVICEGDLHDPDFPQKFRSLLGKLKSILDPPKRRKRFLKVDKVEPWNSVRVTLSIPKEAASKLRQLAAEGSAALRALGILSVQLEGDTVISLRLVGQEIVLRTESENAPALNGPNRNSATANDFTNLLARVPTPQNNQQPSLQQLQQQPQSQQTICAGSSGEGPSGLTTAIKSQQIIRMNSIDPSVPINGPIDAKAIFKSPNTICPMDGKLPTPVPSNVIESREYPFESMTQARVIQRRENTMSQQIQNQTNPLLRPSSEQPTPPPPYPGASPTRNANVNMMNTHIVTNKIAINQQQASTSGNIAISSPLLVNLLQNESAATPNAAAPKQMIAANAPTTIVKNGQEIVILSNNSMPPHQMQQQVNHTPNFVIANNSGTELGFNKCVVNKQTIQSPSPHHQMRVQQQQQQQQTFVNVSTVQSTINESIQQPQPQQPIQIHSNNNIAKDNASNSERNLNNSSVLSTVPQQANNIVIAGNATTVPSTINSVNKIQTRYPQQQAIPPHFQQQFANQSPQMRASMMPAQNANTPQNHHPNQPPMANLIAIPPNQMTTSPQTIPAQVVLQKHQQMRAMHPNMIAQQQQMIGANMHQVEFRQPAPASTPTNVALQPNQMQPNQMHQFQQQQQQQQQQPQQMMQPQVVGGNAIQFNSPMGSQQQVQPQMDQLSRWPLKPMDSATQSSFQEFTRYQMQYNLSQQQQQVAPEDSLADQLADLDEITRTDLESLLPSINESDLDTALGLDMKAPLESLLDAKDLELDLIDPSVDPIETTTVASSTANVLSGAGIPPTPTQTSNVISNQMISMPPQQQQQQQQQQQTSNTMQQHFQQNQVKVPLHPNQTEANINRYRQMQAQNRPMNPQHQIQQMNIMNASMNVPQSPIQSNLQKLTPHIPHTNMVQPKVEYKMKAVAGKEKQVLINPLTGELEPIPSEESGDEMVSADGIISFNEFNVTAANSMYSDDDNSCSTFSKTSDHSDNDRSSNSEYSGKGKNAGKRKEKKESTKKPKIPKEKSSKGSLLKEKLQQGLKEKILGKSKDKSKIKNLPSPVISNATIAEMSDKSNPEKIKLRLKLEKSEPVSPAYKVDVSFGDSSKRPANASNAAGSSSTSHAATSNNAMNTSGTTGEELRVPPLHISLRGRNSVVIKNSKKGRKKSQSGAEEEGDIKKSSKKLSLGAMSAAAPSSVTVESAQLTNNSNRIHHNINDSSTNCNTNINQVNTNMNTNTNTTSTILDHFVDSKKSESLTEQLSGHSEKCDVNMTEASKRLNSDLHASSNGPIQAEKKRRLSQCTTSNIEMPVVTMPSITVGTTLVTSRSSMMPMTDNSVESIREAIGSTNVGTLPKHSSLTPNKVQKSTNNNNNSLTLNKVKPANKLKTKTLINMLNKPQLDAIPTTIAAAGATAPPSQPTATEQITTNPSISVVDKPKPNDLVPQETIDAIRDEQSSQKFPEPNDIDAEHSQSTISQNEHTTPSAVSVDKIEPSMEQNPVAFNDVDAKKDNIELNSNSDSKNNSNGNESTQQIMTTTLPSNTPIVNQTIEAKDSPRRDIIEGIINASQAIRCSPASQAQGEDSGIESMDALSEKSPHQTASPQTNYAKRAESPKENITPKQVATNDMLRDNISADKYSNIEAALAKMEGLNEFMTSDCDKGSVEVETVCDTQKMNGEHTNTLKADNQVELLMHDLAEPIKEKTNDILIAALNEGDDFMANSTEKDTNISNTNSIVMSETKDLNENQTIVEVLEVKTDISDVLQKTADDTSDIKTELNSIEMQNDDSKINATIDNFENSVAETSETVDTTETISEITDDKKTIAEMKVEASEPMEQDPTETTTTSPINETTNEIVKSAVEPTPEPAIESAFESTPELKPEMKSEPVEATPCENDIDSKMEPVKSEEDKEIEDTMKGMEVDSNESKILQQLSIEIPSSENDSSQRVRTRASSKLESPLDALKQSPSDSPAGSTRSIKGAKRKRQESESSTQSNVSDDMPIRAKKVRKSEDVTASSSTSSSPTNLRSGNQSKENILTPIYANDSETTLNRKSEDSSDSDEPLIEVAGKVRNAKMCKVILDDKLVKNHQKLATPSVDGQSNSTNNVSHSSSGDSQVKQIQLPKGDDKSSAMMSTRRSVRMNTGTKISKAIINQNSHGVNLNSNENQSDIRKSGNGTTVNSVNSTESTSSTDARRKTRSAGLEAIAGEGRRRRLSRDSK